jgi:hypothetical protein
MKRSLVLVALVVLALAAPAAAGIANAYLNCQPGHGANAVWWTAPMSRVVGKVIYYNQLTGGLWVQSISPPTSYCGPARGGCLIGTTTVGHAYPWHLRNITEVSSAAVVEEFATCR